MGNFGKTIGRQLWAAALQLGVIVLVARAYGPHGNGIYSVALLLPAMLSLILSVGIGPANVYYLASGKHGLRAVTSTTLRLWAVLSFVGVLLGYAVVILRAPVWFPGITPTTLMLALAAFPAVLFNNLIGSIFQGVEDFSGLNLSLALHPFLCLAAIAVCVVGGLPADLAVASYSVGATATSIVLWWRLRGWRENHGANPQVPYTVREVLSYGMKSHIGSIVAFLNLRIGLFQLNLLTTPAVAGIYAIAAQLAERIWLLSVAVNTVLLPRLASVSGNPGRSTAMMSVVTRATTLATFALATTGALVGLYAITILFGAEYDSAYVPFLYALPGVLAGSCVRILSAEFSARGRPEINTYMAIGVLAVNIPCNIILIPRFGAVGAAASSSIAYIFSLFVRVWVYRVFTGQSARSLLIPRVTDISAILEYATGNRASKER